MSGGSLFAPLGGVLSRFSRGGRSVLWVRACPALETAAPAHAAGYAVPHLYAWRYLTHVGGAA